MNFLIHAFYICIIEYTLINIGQCQRPLLNHTFNALITAQQQNYLGSGTKLRNGRMHDMTLLLATTPSPVLQRTVLLYDDIDTESMGRRDNRRRQSLGGNRGERGNARRGIDSLRKELMKPSVGGPGGGISGSGSRYPSYSATSSIGKIDGLGSLGSGDRYSDHLLRPDVVLSNSPQYPTRFPPGFDDKRASLSGKKSSNSLSEIIKITKKQRLNQADEPAGGLTHVVHSDSDDDEVHDPIQAIKDKIKNTAPMSGPYETQTEIPPSLEIEDQLGVRCTFETQCAWKWTENVPDGFQVMSGAEVVRNNMTGLFPGPVADSVDDANGHFLYARLLPTTPQVNLTSPQFSTTMEKCYLEVYMHQSHMSHGWARVVVEPLHSQESSWVPAEIFGDNFQQWGRKVFRIGRISRDFRIVFEVVPKLNEVQKAHVAIDNLRMVNCFPEGTKSEKCSTSQIKCLMNKVPVCIPLPRICDITQDCDNSEDELLGCDQIPYGGRCDFENDWCGWRDSGKTILSWSRHTGSSPTHDTGPDGDHTYQHILNSTDGYYMLVDMNQHSNNTEKGSLIGFASNAIMISKTFNPPPLVHGNPNSPYRNSCVVRFYIHQFGKNPGSINLSVVEMKEKENITTTLWWSTKNQGSDWLRAEYVLPNITSRYYLQFEARMGMRIYSDVAVDDFSLSPECFGLNIPEEHLDGYNYWNVRYNLKSPAHRDFENKNYLELTTCDTRGMIGPTQQQCEQVYRKNNQSHILNEVKVIEDQSSYKGMQKWRVPHEGYYTIIAKGASGGLGSGGIGSSRGAMTVSVLELHKNEELYILVGQPGEHACIKSMSVKEEGCGVENHAQDLSRYNFSSKQDMVKNIYIENGAGGGGGASFVFLLNSAKNEAVPLVVAAGGGGLGIGQYIDEDFQHGQKINANKPGVTGQIHGEVLNKNSAGPGGGWRGKIDEALSPKYGAALLQGGRGGHSCFVEIGNNGTTINRHGQGGFGGGGGGCNTGGGGGGYAGGDVFLNESNGEGGTSYITTSRSLRDYNTVHEGAHSGAGAVIIIPAIEGCGCDYRCIALDEFRHSVRCICPEGWRIKRDNNTACEVLSEERIPFHYLIGFFVFLMVLLGTALTALMSLLYTRYQRAKEHKMRHNMSVEQDLQLNRMRHNLGDSNLTNFNPNYGCDGILNGHIDAKNLPKIGRESLRLIKPLGQGAFGEVYQGLYKKRQGDTVECAVAVKTLPEMSTKQSEEDFLMEACIMAKFDHPNMVHLIGVCFENHPRFIVLELLAGGDLKNFLRENRNKPDRPSPLTMKDLVLMALDVANGCQYMESKRFIHRDIAARNCLLSSKGPGRVVKIADFGMARDIYRSDYYRKGGKAMLPIKWMPPEAFLDGIFTSKTDVWSFGVLLWEVFSLGLMPYTGLPNPEVMTLVTSGGRLGVPMDCPPRIYQIMADCWNPAPEQRPDFTQILDRLKQCKELHEIMEAPLPNIFRPPSTEREQTVLRPPNGEEYCFSIPRSSEYLLPIPTIHNGGEYAGTIPRSSSIGTMAKSVCTPPVVHSPSGSTGHTEDNSGCWETSFILPNSKSDQLLLGSHNDSLAANALNGHAINNNNYNSVTTNTASTTATTTTTAEGKLISLDTPQPTPTTIQPPHSFASQLDGITLDASALSALSMQPNSSKQSYANVQMTDVNMKKLPNGDVNGIMPNGSFLINGITKNEYEHNNTANTNGGLETARKAPFTIQGYSEGFKDNHSEISC